MTRHLLALGRRGLLRGAGGLAALAALPAAAEEAVAGYPFALGVASGDPWPDSVVLWTRLATAPLAPGGGMGDAVVPVGWELAADEGFRQVLQSGTAEARPESGHAVHVEPAGLQPGQEYWYRFTARGELSPPGRTRTAPAPGAAPARLRFVNAGCQRFDHGYYTAWRHVAEEAPLDFVFHYGDYIYEYARRQPGQRGWGVPARDHEGGECVTLAEYRRRYAQYHADPDLQAAHAAHPFIASFDDHEVENNWAGGHGPKSGRSPEFLLRRAAAFQAWYENLPVRRALAPQGAEILAHRRFAFGSLLDLHVLDTRQYREVQPCGGRFLACEAAARPEAQMLGAAQEDWLLRGIAGSAARWQVLAQQVMMMRRAREGAVSTDAWDGYAAARDRLLRALHARRADAVVLTGDVHAAWAGSLRLDPLDPASLGVAAEFVGTSISSGGDGSETVAHTGQFLRENPHIRFFNNRRGYTLHEASAGRLEAVFRAVARVSEPGAAREDRGHFVVEAGRPGELAAG